MKTWYKRGVAFLLTFASFLPQTTVLAADDQPPELPAYTSALYSTQFDQNNPDEGKIDSTNNTVSWDDPIYYVVNKFELIGSNPSGDDIQEGKIYRISLPDPLVCAREIDNEPIRYESDELTSGSKVVTFARVNASKGANYLEISFKIESDGHTLDQLQDIHFSFSCNWDRDKAEEMDTDNDGNIQIATLPDMTDVHITELEPPPPIKNTLIKTQTTSNTGETTWTVHCSIGNEAGNIPDSLVDILPDGISYVDGSAVVTTVPADAGNGSAAQYDSITRTLTYALPADATEATLQYKTTLTDDVITKFWQNGKVYTINNDVEARFGTAVCADATCRVSYNQLKPLLQKSFKDLDYDEATGQYFVTWGVRVDLQGQTLNQLKLHDTYGAALLLPKSGTSDDVDFDALEMKIAYTDPNRPDPVIEIDAEDVAIDQIARTLVIDLEPYFSKMTGLPSQPFEVTYKMQVDKTILEQGGSKESFRNQVYGQFQTQSMQQPAQSVLSTADLPVKTENTLVLQSGIGYDSKTRALKWKTTINPGLMATDPTLKGPNLTSVVYEDRFTKDATNPNLVGYDYQTFGLNAEVIKAQEDSIRSQIQKQIENIPGAEAKVSIQETDTDRVLRVELKGTGTASISFDYSTYILKPEHWASNASNLVFRNSVRLLKEGTEIDGIPITNDASAVSQIKVSGTILKKWPMGTYYTTDNKLQWELVLNDRNAPLGTIQVIDQLPEGMQYVPGSAKLDGQPISETNAGDDGNYVSQEGQSIIFHLNNIQAKQYRVLFTTTVDPNASVVKQNKQVRFRNQATVKVWSESDQKWIQTATASETATLNYSVLKKDVIQASGSDNGVREARYTVQINPLRMQLQNTSADQLVVQDTLADGLILDMDSVQLYEGITPPFKK